MAKPVIPAAKPPEPKQPAKLETFYHLKKMPGLSVMYSVERITVEDDIVTARAVVTERDIRSIAMEKMNRFVEGELR